ncbi:subtilisin-like protease SBT2.5 isoform X3 [Tanacetum coccineum]
MNRFQYTEENVTLIRILKRASATERLSGPGILLNLLRFLVHLNPSADFASPLDGDVHGSHTTTIAVGNNGIPVRLHGYEYGRTSRMAPRSRFSLKLSRNVDYGVHNILQVFGGFVADVVAAIEQAVHDGVDIINISVGPNSPPATTQTNFLNPFDDVLLSAVKSGVFVAQAARNEGPFAKTMVSYTSAFHSSGKRPRTYNDLNENEKKRFDADIRATNIVLQGLPKDIYKLINHNIEAKAIWDNVKMLLAGSELTKEDHES